MCHQRGQPAQACVGVNKTCAPAARRPAHLGPVAGQCLVCGVEQQLVVDVLRVAAGWAPPLYGQVPLQACRGLSQHL